MASTFSNNLRIELIAVGEQANTWGGTTNTNLGTLLEQAITGGVSIDVTAGNVTLTALDGASDQSRPMVIIATGTPGATRTITAPAKGKVYIVYNNSNASLNFIASGGGGVTLIAGAKKFIYCDSINFYEAINALTVTSGTIDGTTIGATTATTGRFTTVNASGQVTSTVTTGTAPFVVASTTAVANLTSSNVTTNANLTGDVTSVGNATTVVTNANLSGAVTSSGSNVTSLGSFTSANLATALTDETGSGSAVFSTSPTFTGTVNTADLAYTGTLTGGTGVVAIGTNQIYKDASGNVGIGTTSPAKKLDVLGEAQISFDSINTYLYYQSTNNYTGRNTDGNMWMNVASGQNNIFGVAGVEKMRIDSVGNVTLQKNISVGAAAPTTSGTGITFPATQSASTNANTLDDYEEGTWTPVLTSGFTTTGTVTTSGFYTKIGNQVTVKFLIQATTVSPANNAVMSGLPFAGVYSVGAASTNGGGAVSMGLVSPSGTTLVFSGVSIASANIIGSIVITV